MKETATQVLLRTSQKWYKIRNFDVTTRRKLMLLPEKEFEAELLKLRHVIKFVA